MTDFYSDMGQGYDECPEPDIDVCQNCGRYFDWGSPARAELVNRLGLTDGAELQRCYRCIQI